MTRSAMSVDGDAAAADVATRPSRVSYWFSRLLRLNVTNMLAMARQISTRFHRSFPVIVADMLWCAARYNAGYYDYHEFEFHLLSGPERRTYLTRPEANHLTRMLNPASHRSLMADKVRFNEVFAEFIGREWIDARRIDGDELREFVERHDRVMLKSTGSEAGAGVAPIRAGEVADWEGLRAELVRDGRHLVEERIVQHPDLSLLHPASVNTLRIVTWLDVDTDRVHMLASVLKIGNGQPVDNFGRHGMYTVVDESGYLRYDAFDKAGDIYSRHPITGIVFRGFRVPLWDEVQDFVQRLARVVPEIPYVGWDIAVTPHGPVVVEGNYNTGVFQMKPSITGIHEGLVPKYKAAIGDRWPR